MMIIMSTDATDQQVEAVTERVLTLGFTPHSSRGTERTIIGIVGNNPIAAQSQFAHMPGVDRIVPISRPYKLASREFIPQNSTFPLDGVQFGGDGVILIAGPCAVEDRSLLLETSHAVQEAGAHALRAGAFKPRTSPYAFQGLGEAALEMLAEVREVTGLPVVTEAMSSDQVPLVAHYADVIQIGARNMQNYNLLNPANVSFGGLFNYRFFYTDPAFFQSIWNTLLIVGGVLFITIVGGIAIALLLDQPIFGQGLVRIMIISPFFVMPPVAALVWKNMIMHPGYGVLADINRALGFQPVDWFAQYPLFSIIIIVAWQWLPFATLILLTALQSLDGEQKEAAEMDGAGFIDQFIYLVLPHLARAITVVILIQTIFLLGVYAEILVTTNGGPGYASTNLAFLIYRTALLGYDVGGASAGGIIAVILANIVAFFLMRAVGRNLDR